MTTITLDRMPIPQRSAAQIIDDSFAALCVAIAATGENSAVVAAISAQELQKHAPFRIDRIYCTKTGADLGERRIDQLGAMIDAYGERTAIDVLPYLLQTAVHPLWVKTDGAALDAAEQTDPVGYFVYSAAQALMSHYTDYNPIRREWRTQESKLRWMADKIILHERVSSRPIDEIRERNAVWRIYHRLILPRYAPLPVLRLADYSEDSNWSTFATTVKTTLTNFAKHHNQQFSETNFRHLYNQQLMDETLGIRGRDGGRPLKGASSFKAQKRYKASTLVTELSFFDGIDRDATNAIDALFANIDVSGGRNVWKTHTTPAKPYTPTGGFRVNPANNGALNSLLETVTAPAQSSSAPVPTASPSESFASLARKLSSKLGGTNSGFILGKKG